MSNLESSRAWTGSWTSLEKPLCLPRQDLALLPFSHAKLVQVENPAVWRAAPPLLLGTRLLVLGNLAVETEDKRRVTGY
jgi:hypothetical protein